MFRHRDAILRELWTKHYNSNTFVYVLHRPTAVIKMLKFIFINFSCILEILYNLEF